MRKPMCTSLLALCGRVAPRACLSIGFSDLFSGNRGRQPGSHPCGAWDSRRRSDLLSRFSFRFQPDRILPIVF